LVSLDWISFVSIEEAKFMILKVKLGMTSWADDKVEWRYLFEDGEIKIPKDKFWMVYFRTCWNPENWLALANMTIVRDVVVHTCNPSTGEAEARGLTIPRQLRLHNETGRKEGREWGREGVRKEGKKEAKKEGKKC
jgi:hypothetical protein